MQHDCRLPINLNKLTALCFSAGLWLVGCTSPQAIGGDLDLKSKFKGMGVEVVIDGVNEYQYVTINEENNIQIAAFSKVGPKNRDRSFSGSDYPIPKSIHVVWRSPKDGKAIMDNGILRYEGTIIGDYTVPVAVRIPDALLDDLRRNPRGDLRLKIRLIDDGVLIGWDIERRPGFDAKRAREENIYYAAEHSFVGGDFQERQIKNGKIISKGWYIDKSGQRIETDY